jgi:hypothetical protein
MEGAGVTEFALLSDIEFLEREAAECRRLADAGDLRQALKAAAFRWAVTCLREGHKKPMPKGWRDANQTVSREAAGVEQ